MSEVWRPWLRLICVIVPFGLLVGFTVAGPFGSGPRGHGATGWLAVAAGSAALFFACFGVIRRLDKETRQRNKRLSETVNSLEEQVRALGLELEAARKSLLDANAAKSSFLTNMSHEFRTPMNAIIGFSEVLNDQMCGPLNGKQQEYVGNILASGRHLLELLSDILELSTVEGGNVTLDFSTFLVQDLIASCVNLHRSSAISRRIRLDVEVSEDAPVRMEGDERRLRRVLGNLLSNALKFTLDGGRVTVLAQKASCQGPLGHGEGIIISVRDSGIGIRSDDMSRLFKEFFQVENPYTKTYEGTGLGLAMSRRIVDLHGGSIAVESALGLGSTFSFTLPLSQTPAPHAQPGATPGSGRATHDTEGKPRPW